MDGLITQGEKYNKVVDAWSKCNDKVTDAMMGSISTAQTDDDGSQREPNSVYMMAHSGCAWFSNSNEANWVACAV